MALPLFHAPPEPGERPHLIGALCRRCGRAAFPARAVCAGCGSLDMDSAALGRRGRVQSGTVVYHAPTGFTAPYLLALVELEEGPVVFCPVTGCPPEEVNVAPGTPVELVIQPARPGGSPVIHYRPIREEVRHDNPR